MKKSFTSKDLIGIVGNDAGASNLLLAWVLNNPSLNYFFCLKGPAKKIFEEKELIYPLKDIEEIIENCNVIITGTSYHSMLEHNTRFRAKKLNILSISVIDHWCNYELRFIRNKQKVLPDIIWVFDEIAEDIAKNLFKDTKIQRQNNFYLEGLVKEITPLKKRQPFEGSRILYVLEPIKEKSHIDELPYEYLVLDYFIEKINKLNLKQNIEIRLRLHPSENINKYDDWINNQNDYDISISSKKTLSEDISWADIVIGYDTYALVVGSAASRKCFSSKLPYEENCELKIKDLKYLRDLN